MSSDDAAYFKIFIWLYILFLVTHHISCTFFISLLSSFVDLDIPVILIVAYSEG